VRDSESAYGGPAITTLLSAVDLSTASSVFEFGCGSGRLAHMLLSQRLPPGCSYSAADISPVMVDLARRRLEPFGARVAVRLTDGCPKDALADVAEGQCDVFLST
jgi:SAM-dependent methyltransferase